MADTLLSVAQEELAKIASEQTRAKAELAQAQSDLAQAQAEIDSTTSSLTTLKDEGTMIRRKIDETTSAAEGQQLFEDLEQNAMKTRLAQTKLAGAQERLAYAQSRITATLAELNLAASAAQAADAAVESAQQRDADHSAWGTAATSTALAGLPAKADVANPGPAKTAADDVATRLAAYFPADLLTRATERRNRRQARLAAIRKAARDAEDKLADETESAGLAGKSAKTRLAFERSETALRDFALTAQEGYDHALALLAGVRSRTPTTAAEKAATSNPVLSDEEKQRVTDLAAEALTANAYALQKDRDDKQADLDAALDAVGTAYLAALAADPTKDPNTDAGVTTAQAQVTAEQSALDTAQTAYEAAKPKLDALEAAVPDDAWGPIADNAEALWILGRLKAINPSGLVSALTNAEDTYAQALRAEQDNARVVLALGGLTKEREDRATAVGQTRSSALLAAVRGDE
jgi:hypothetical protein